MSKRVRPLFALLAALLLTACHDTARLYIYQPVDPHGWNCTDTLRYDLPADTVAILRTYSLGVRFTEQMAYRNLWLVLEQRVTPLGSPTQVPPARRDTLCLSLAHDNGRWEGTGVICHEVQAVCTAAHTTAAAPMQLLVYHIMPQQAICGITEVGLKVE